MANAAINAALIAAAQQQAATQKLILDPLKAASARSPRTAVELDLSAKGADKMLEHLLKRGHVRAAGGGRYWLDEAAVARSKAAATRTVWILLAFLASLSASLLALAFALN